MQIRPPYIRSDTEENFIALRREQGSDPADTPQLNERVMGEYQHYLGLDIGSLAGKKVLNIGAGKTGIFDKDLARQGAEIISLSPNFANTDPGAKIMKEAYAPQFRHKFAKIFGSKINWPIPLAGAAEQIPLEDNSIDIALGLYSFPIYTTDLTKAIKEITRVLSDKGEARLFPVNNEYKVAIESLFEKDKRNQVEFKEIQEGTDGAYTGEKTYLLVIKKMA